MKTRQWIKRAALAVAFLAIVFAAGLFAWGRYARSEAKRLSLSGAWSECRQVLRPYLWLRRGDADARLLMAEAWVRDASLPLEDSLAHAIRLLRGIPDDSPLGSVARAKEARIRFLLLRQPCRAEKLFRRALQLDPQSEENAYLLWKIWEVTGRYQQTAPLFWRLYELTPPERRAERLREWYMSQFFPTTANIDFDRMFGVLGDSDSPTGRTEHERMLVFRRQEPQAATLVAALARWYQEDGDPAFALRLLREQESLQEPLSNSFYVAALVSVLFDLGELDEAARRLQDWPPPRDGYEYWKLRGMIHDEVSRDDSEAVRCYEAALATWPGPIDWRTQSRLAHCLARLRQHDRARTIRRTVKAIQAAMKEEVHQRLRLVLGDLRNPDQLEEIVRYYRSLGCTREAVAWSEHIARLRTAAASGPEPAARGQSTPEMEHWPGAAGSTVWLSFESSSHKEQLP